MTTITQVILAHQTKFPDLNAWEFDERVKLEVDSNIAWDIRVAWGIYLDTQEHEVFVERLREILSDEHSEDTKANILEAWAGE